MNAPCSCFMRFGLTLIALLALMLVLPARYASAQADTNLVVDSTAGDVDQNEVDTFISFMTNTGGVNANAVFPTNALGDNLAYGTPGLNLEAINYMYRITGDMMVNNPNLSTEHMQLMNLAISWSECFILLRNDQVNGGHQVMWTGNVDPVWQTYATGTAEAGYAGSENGDTAGHILFTALNILQTPSIWNQTVPDGNPNNFGVTYLQRAQTYINMMENTTQNYFTKYFINTSTYQIVPPTSPAWTVFNENMDAWNRQFLLTNDYLRLAQCHAILGDNPTLQTLYTNIVKTSVNAYVANALPVTASQTVSTSYPAKEAVYDSGYGNEGDVTGQTTGNSSSHTSYEFQGLARTYEAGPAYSSTTLMNMERYANTVEYAMFDYPGYPPPGSYPPFNVKLSSTYVTAYYKNIDAGLVLPTTNATSDYLYGQFYFMTPYNTLFWQPAANGAAPNNHNNYHNNPYYTVGILYSKHWVYMNPQTLISVASNTASTTVGGTATYTITTNSTSPVTLSIPDLPAGATATFTPTTVPAGTGSSTLTVTAPSNSTNGSTLFTLTGTSGSSVQTLGLSLITTAPDFTISSTGTSTVADGSSGSWTVTVAALNGFTGSVTLSADPVLALAGSTITFNPDTITGGSGTSVVTATTSTTVPTPGGEWPEGFIGVSGATTHETYSRLTVNSVPQTINFPAIANVAYGTAPIPLPAATNQNLAITYTVTGPVTLQGGNTLAGQSLAVTGIGAVTVTAAQAGNTYNAAATPVTRNFTVTPAVLTVAAQNQSITYGSALPTLTSSTTGFVNGDTSSVVSGSPALATTATATSPAGSYPISVAAGTLAAANYTFALTNGTLTITQASSAAALTVSPTTTTLGQIVTMTATVTSTAGTPTGKVTFMNGTAVLGTATLSASGVAVLTSTTLPIGTYSISAVYSGDTNFTGSTAPASGVLTITQASSATTLTITPASTTSGQSVTMTATVTATAGTPTGTVTFLNGTAVLGNATLSASGVAVFTSSTLAAGNYAVSAVYGGSTNFTSSTTAATVPLAIADYTLSASPSTLTITDGQTGSTTITVTPIANYKGSLTLSCGQLPTDVNCSFSNASPSLDGTGTAVTTTLTVSTHATVAELRSPTRQRVFNASLLCWPALFSGLVLVFASRKRVGLQRLLVALITLGVLGMSACSSNSNNDAAKGTTTVAITGSSSSSLSHTLNLTVTIQ